MDRRTLLLAGAALAAPRLAHAQETPGVTATEIRFGGTTALSGPVSALGVQCRAVEGVCRMVNEAGGIAGRRLTYILYDDGFSPPKTLEQVRRLVEQDRVAFLFNMLGTAPNNAVVRYVNQRKVPHLFLSVNGDKWGDYATNPWTTGFAPSARTEAQVFARHALAEKPDARFALLHQNDDFGRDYVHGLRDVLGAAYDQRVRVASYEVTDPTVDSQLIALQGADVLISGVTAKFAAMAIRKIHEMGWKATHYIASGASSVAGVIQPAGVERATGTVSSAYLKDPNDPAWAADAGMAEYRRFMARWLPEADTTDIYYTYGYTVALVLVQVLAQCQGQLTRERIMREAANLRGLEIPTLLPGIKVDTSPTDYRPLQQLQLIRWDGRMWQRFGPVIDGAAA
ncbi:ABC transporter substrate-binding protein [Paracraurococcus ruber]|uniref:Branched-chain amino acid ABC transporter substrate-binding protein n=1 Tax=Paracraurococcus ruber TaxID=77675 RepID=A0ABS1CX06_9PROT|nr:ABC transporter substrate-binding protein [Paracraurococcus ruber]MBK1659055.1 branched-chain amino acid ABC transporter substrate-binding protein [Paracraurococcus ruber]TDG30036.1 branched-chain amino acid ABC transporter substrate-binding protein [Paracraurococcus ruber]